MIRALIIGSAACMADDLVAAAALFAPDLVIAVNQAAAVYAGPLDHWVTMHIEIVERWRQHREQLGLPPAGAYWTAERRIIPDPRLKVRFAENWGGSSGLLACTVALKLGVDRGVLCGIPMDIRQGHFNQPQPWTDGGNYRKRWLANLERLSHIRSMSGLTREWLGEPTEDWLNGAL